MFNDPINKNELAPSFEEEKSYLTPSQAEEVKNKLSSALSFAGQQELLDLIDSYVKSNDKADEAYSRLFDAVKAIGALSKTGDQYPARISNNLPALYGIGIFDILSLTGVVTEDDVEKIAGEVDGLLDSLSDTKKKQNLA